MIFVVGNSRSGTTMMGRILGKHPDIYTFGELHFFGQLCAPPFSSELRKANVAKLAAELYCVQQEGYRTHGNPHRFLKEAQVFLNDLTSYPETPALLFSAFLHHEATKKRQNHPVRSDTAQRILYQGYPRTLSEGTNYQHDPRPPRCPIIPKAEVETSIPRR